MQANLLRSVLVVGLVACLAGVGRHAEAQVGSCSRQKVKVAGQAAAAKLQCHAVAVGAGTAPDPGCLSRAEIDFDSGFARAEDRGDCATTGDAVSVEALVDGFVDGFVAGLGSPSDVPGIACAACKLKAARSHVRCVSRTIARDLLGPEIVLGRCSLRVAGRWMSCERRAGGACAIDQDLSSASAGIEDFADQAAERVGAKKTCEDSALRAQPSDTACETDAAACVMKATTAVVNSANTSCARFCPRAYPCTNTSDRCLPKPLEDLGSPAPVVKAPPVKDCEDKTHTWCRVEYNYRCTCECR